MESLKTPENGEHRHAVELIRKRGYAKEVPTASEITTSDLSRRFTIPFYSQRKGYSYGLDYAPNADVLSSMSEGDALLDFQHKMLGFEKALENVADVMDYYKMSTAVTRARLAGSAMLAERLRTELRFMGQPEVESSITGMASYLQEELERNKTIHLAVSAGKSSSFLCKQIVERMDAPTENIHIFDIDDISPYRNYHSPQKEVPKKIHIIDDWNISNSQMNGIVGEMRYGLSSNSVKLEVNYLCATEDVIEKGIAGVPVRAFFKRPRTKTVAADFAPRDDPSITGSHSSVDYGSRHLARHLRLSLKDAVIDIQENGSSHGIDPEFAEDMFASYANFSLPALLYAAKPYKLPTHRHPAHYIEHPHPDISFDSLDQQTREVKEWEERLAYEI